MGHDTRGRRDRLRPTSTGKRLTPTARDLIWFQKLQEHGPLPSGYLHAFTKDLRRNEKRAIERLTDLFNEDNTPHGGPYLTRPVQQFRTIDSRYNQLVHDITPAALAALQEAELSLDRVAHAGGPWAHGFMVACITASIELATIGRTDVQYIPGSAVLERAKTDLSYQLGVSKLIPDALFGLEYRTKGGARFRFFVLEADRGTEPVSSENRKRKSFLRSLQQYEEYIGMGRYKEHLGLRAPLLLLQVATSERRIEAMMRAAEKNRQRYPWCLFRAISSFGEPLRPPSVLQSLLEEDWLRVRCEPFCIADP